MSIVLRIVLILISSITFMIMVRKIRNAKVQIENSLFWIVFSMLLLILSVFPQIAVYAARLLGIQTPVNFIFLFVIFILLLQQFFVSIKISQLENKLKELIQELAVREVLIKEEDKKKINE